MRDDDKKRLNARLQEIAWETVTHHPMTGLMKQFERRIETRLGDSLKSGLERFMLIAET